MKFRILAAVAALVIAAIPAAAATAKPATPLRPAPAAAAAHTSAGVAAQRPATATAVKASTASLTGCTTTVTPSTSFSGWTWRTTYEVCPSLGDTQQAQSCVTVDRYNPVAVPTTVVVLQRTCLYARAR